MEENEQIEEKKRSKGWLIVMLCLSMVFVLLAVVAAFLLLINRMTVDVQMLGTSEMTLEYGSKFVDPGATARLRGSLVFREGFELPVAASGTVNEDQLGSYEIVYEASWSRWIGTATRTVHVKDSKAPAITLITSEGAYTIPGDPYQEEGYFAIDNHDGDITSHVQAVEENGVVTYMVSDTSGNIATATRQIRYYDPTPPELSLLGETYIELMAGETYNEPGWTASDNYHGDLTQDVTVTGEVDVYLAGTYELQYQVKDFFGNVATAARTVVVKPHPHTKVVRPEGKVIYLTFDDGPSAYTEDLLEVLAKYDVKATFFVVDSDYNDVMKKIVEDGHSIGIHTTTHDYDEIYASVEAYLKDLYNIQRIVEEQTGVKTTLMRFPGGSSNTVSSITPGIMTQLTKQVQDLGFQYFDWNVDSGDAGGTRKTDQVYENVIAGVQRQKISIVLQHDIKGYSVEAVERIIQWGQKNGYTFMALEQNSPTAHHGVNN